MDLAAARVFVRDLVAARDFYSKLIGLHLEHDGVAYGYCVFSAGLTELVLEAVGVDAPQEEQGLVGRFTGLSFAIYDVQATYQAMSRAGVIFTGVPEVQSWGGILATFRDPEGNEFQLVQKSVA